MRVAVIGGGINGVMSALAMARRGHRVELFERDQVMAATSSASTKLLHGGLRYLERGSFRLVRESLRERAWWLGAAPDLCGPLRLLLPVWKGSGRAGWKLRLGLSLYDLLAGSARIARHRWRSPIETIRIAPFLRREGLSGAFEFWDAWMDDRGLGLRAVEWARESGVLVRELCAVRKISLDGRLDSAAGEFRFDRILNVAGPWTETLLRRSGLPIRTRLDLVRGSHLVIGRPCPCGVLAQVPGETRIGFVLPWKGETLVGTTEVRQTDADPIVCSEAEREYLRRFFDQVCAEPLANGEIRGEFAGVRPLLRGDDSDAGRVSREYRIERSGTILSVFGGKWTTARILGEKVARLAER